MTVQELIQKLEACDPEATVNLMDTNDGFTPLTVVDATTMDDPDPLCPAVWLWTEKA